jgi:hypothetical protein
MKFVQLAWDEYAKHQMPADATPQVRALMRRQFFAGAYCLFDVMQRLAELSQDTQASANEELRVELAMFAATLGTTLEGMV